MSVKKLCRYRQLQAAILISWCIFLVGTLTCPSIKAQDPSVVGQWGPVLNWPIVAVHAHLLPTGKVLFYPYSDDPRLWDPVTGAITSAAPAGYNIFCTGHTFLPDGRLLVSGGHIANNVGEDKATIYDPFTNTWTRLPNMNAGRWYPTNTALANGDILVVSGDRDTTVGVNVLPQVWDTANNAWRNLTNAQLGLNLYPSMLLAPNGKVFFSMPDQISRYLDTSGSGLWTTVGLRKFGNRSYGSSAMYDDGKVLVVGGGDPPTNTTEVIDLNAVTPAWRYVGAMHNARRQFDATLLPDGKILATGGSSGAGFDDSSAPVFDAEMWDPATEQWTTMAGNTKYHGYHSNALLLPDGRVLTTGGDNQLNAEIYSPPYLFKSARPTITSAPQSVGYGQTFFVQTPNAASIAKVTWIRLPSVTHAFDQNQRINRLSFSQTANGLNVTAPSSGNLCPPGHYMLFILNTDGVPSVAKIIQIGNASVPAPAAPSSLSATVASPSQIDLSWLDNSFNEDGFKIERCQPGSAVGTSTTPAVTVQSAAADETVVDVVSYGSSTAPPTIAANSSQTELWNFRSINADFGIGGACSTKPGASSVGMAWTLSESRNWAIEAVSVKGASGSPPTLDAVSHSAIASTASPYQWNHTCTGTNRALIVGIALANANDTVTNVMYNSVPMLRVASAVQGTARVYIFYLPNPASGTNPISVAFTGGFTSFSVGAVSFTDVDQLQPIRQGTDCTNFSEIAQVGSGTVSYSNTGLASGTNYSYRVRAYNVGGDSSYSNTASANTSTPPPAAPLNLAASAISATRIDLTWTDNTSNEDGFKIERCQGSACSNFSEIAQVGSGTVSYSNTGLASGTNYSYRVRAYN
ncbi:MAG TPA: galactose oxidase-like domain-containing protein, partial [Pyrinomonadaceae bacterium]|nr:galactose oxidase-like domain-containing protein [Pyrinomonadaceae bacterium]